MQILLIGPAEFIPYVKNAYIECNYFSYEPISSYCKRVYKWKLHLQQVSPNIIEG